MSTKAHPLNVTKTSIMTTLFNFRNCYTVEDIEKSNISYSLEFLCSLIQHYFFIDQYGDTVIYAVDFYTISIPDKHRQSGQSEIIGVISDLGDWRNEIYADSVGKMTWVEVLELLLATYAKLHDNIKITHYDENGVGTVI